MSASSAPPWTRIVFILVVGTLAVSTAAPFIALAQMHPLTLSAGRLLGAALLYALIGRDTLSGWHSLSPENRRRLLLGTPLLTLHFAFWIAAFEFTDLPSAVLLLVLQPLLASWVGARMFRESVTPGIAVALVVAVAGLGVITYDDVQLSADHLIGDVLVALGAISIIGFLSVGKRLRPHLSFPAYMSLTYGSAGLWALLLVVLFGAPVTGYPTASYGWMLGLVFITTGVGHAGLNYVLPHMRLFTLNLATVAEPVIAIIAAVLFLGQTVTPSEIVGGVLLTASLFVGVRDERPRASSVEPAAIPPINV